MNNKENKSLYRKLVPSFIRKAIKENKMKNLILKYYENKAPSEINEEEKEVLNYLQHNKISVFPYSFQKDYKKSDVEVFMDETLNLKYVVFEGKRIYFKRKSSMRGVRRNYTNLLIEQDVKSPHRYLSPDFDLSENDILVDVGAAEGNLPLSVIEKVKKVYLFETDENWLEPLRATFAPWKDKVEIINKFVSDKNDATHVSLDEFFKDKEQFSVLKIDAEGAEGDILNGCKRILSETNSMKLAICCYHKPNDEKEFEEIFKKYDFSIGCTKGYMIFDDPKTFFPPYLRRGIMIARKG